MTRAKLLLQDGEADALERVLDILLTDQKYAYIFESGEERRCIRRVSKKIFWTKADAT